MFAARRQSELSPEEASLGLILESPSGKRLAYMPAVPQIYRRIAAGIRIGRRAALRRHFLERRRTHPHSRSGANRATNGTRSCLVGEWQSRPIGGIKRPRRIYVHINNTNPMLNEAGPEYRQVRDAGWEIAEDGWQFEL